MFFIRNEVRSMRDVLTVLSGAILGLFSVGGVGRFRNPWLLSTATICRQP